MRLVIAGLYVLAMLVAAVLPVSAMAPMAVSSSATSTADCGSGMSDMKQTPHDAKFAGGACGLTDHQNGAPCMLGSICADLPSGMFANLLPMSILSESEQLAIVSATPLPGIDPAPGLRPPRLSV